MSTHNICFRGEIRKISVLFGRKNGFIWSYDYKFVFLCVAMTVIDVKWSLIRKKKQVR